MTSRFINPPNLLKKKVSAGGSGGGQIDPQALLRAQAVIDSKVDDYPKWAERAVDSLYVHYQLCVDDPGHRGAHIAKIANLVHDIRGEGSTYGYPLVTKIGTSLYDFAQATGKASDAQLEVIKAHIDALKVVIGQRMSGDGGETGAELLNMLRLAANKFLAAEHE